MKKRTIKVLKKLLDFKRIRLTEDQFQGREIRDYTEFSLRTQKKHSSLW